jgi:hypothetical protein
MLRVPQGLPDGEILFDEFSSFVSESSPKGKSITFRPLGKGSDDIIDALSLVAYAAEKRWEPRWTREPVGLTVGSSKRRPVSLNRGNYGSNLSRSIYATIHRDYSRLRGW